RLDPRRRRAGVEGDGERVAGAAREAADDGAAEADVAARDADLPRAAALVADRHRVLGSEARDRQRAAVEVVVGVAEGDAGVEELRGGVDRVLEKGHRRGEAGQGGDRVGHPATPFPVRELPSRREEKSKIITWPPRTAGARNEPI